MGGSVSILKLWTDSSTRSTQPRMTVWESDFPLVSRSLPAIMDVSGRRCTRVPEPRFHSHFLFHTTFDSLISITNQYQSTIDALNRVAHAHARPLQIHGRSVAGCE